MRTEAHIEQSEGLGGHVKGLMDMFGEKKLGELFTSVFVRFCIYTYDVPRDRGPLNVSAGLDSYLYGSFTSISYAITAIYTTPARNSPRSISLI